MTSPQPTMIRKVKNGMSTGGRSCGGKSANPISVDVITGEVSEEDLDRHEYGSEGQPHAQHDVRFGGIFPSQHVPGPGGGNAEGAGYIRGKQHVRESHPDHRTEDDLGPVVGN